jgi:hypothetical protein
MLRFLLFLAFLFPLPGYAQNELIYEVSSGTIRFSSDAPQELIRASSSRLKGILNLSNKTFAFKIDIATFAGFNNPLQREHFNENYMESNIFPAATYKGKIIEDVDLQKDGRYEVRAKGKLNIHGVEQERIIRVWLTVRKKKIIAKAEFYVLLTDHNIKIPRVVNEKLSPEIQVSLTANLQEK